jgi:toxin FitB
VKGWLLDINVISELSRPRPDDAVAAWMAALQPTSLFISILTVGEIIQGICKLPARNPARARFETVLAGLDAQFTGRTLPVTDAAVRRWGELSGAELALGRRPPVIDFMLACTAIEAGLYLATRNVRDVRATGAAVFNPWTDDPGRFPLA